MLFGKILVTLIFLSTGLSKIKSFPEFISTVREFCFINSKTKITSNLILKLLAILVVITEITLSLTLWIPVFYLVSMILIIIMLNFFSIAVMYKLSKQIKINCNCGGFMGKNNISKEIPIRNSILSLILVFILFFTENNKNFHIVDIIFSGISVLIVLFVYKFIQKANSNLKI